MQVFNRITRMWIHGSLRGVKSQLVAFHPNWGEREWKDSRSDCVLSCLLHKCCLHPNDIIRTV